MGKYRVSTVQFVDKRRDLLFDGEVTATSVRKVIKAFLKGEYARGLVLFGLKDGVPDMFKYGSMPYVVVKSRAATPQDVAEMWRRYNEAVKQGYAHTP